MVRQNWGNYIEFEGVWLLVSWWTSSLIGGVAARPWSRASVLLRRLGPGPRLGSRFGAGTRFRPLAVFATPRSVVPRLRPGPRPRVVGPGAAPRPGPATRATARTAPFLADFQLFPVKLKIILRKQKNHYFWIRKEMEFITYLVIQGILHVPLAEKLDHSLTSSRRVGIGITNVTHFTEILFQLLQKLQNGEQVTLDWRWKKQVADEAILTLHEVLDEMLSTNNL